VRELNAQYRHRDGTTDVLSFPLADPHAPQVDSAQVDPVQLLGDVVISVEQAARQAPGGELEPEIARLLAHGLCHLLGHDHQRHTDACRMRDEERRLLAPLGIDPMLDRALPR